MKVNKQIKNASYTFLTFLLLGCGAAEQQAIDGNTETSNSKKKSIEAKNTDSNELIVDEENLALEKEASADSIVPALATPPKIPERNRTLPQELADKDEINYNGSMISKDSSRLFKIEIYLEKKGGKYRGFYRYEGKTAKIFIQGKVNSKGVLNLVERINGEETGMFRLQKQENNQWSFTGDWRSPDGSRNFNVYFKKM